MNSWLFPPLTREVQLDEKWAFVRKKQEHCDLNDPADAFCGDNWDHVAFDPEHRLVVAVVPGKRNAANCHKLLAEFRQRTSGRMMRLMTSDDYPSYKIAINDVYGLRSVPLKLAQTVRGPQRTITRKRPPPELNYARICKRRENGQVVEVTIQIVFGSEESVAAALKQSAVSRAVNTSFLERYNGTDRHHNARKIRRTYCFSKDWLMHQAMTWFTIYSYNFCWPVRTLARTDRQGRRHLRTPAMSAGLTDHVWSLEQWVCTPVTQSL
jgi:IS1 family transposase